MPSKPASRCASRDGLQPQASAPPRRQRPRGLAVIRAYYVGQLGRYVPGKVVGLGMRAKLLTGPGVRPGVAVLTVVYESLTTIAAGVLLGLLVFAFRSPDQPALGWRALALLAVVGVLLCPGVFNRLAERTTRPFRRPDSPPLPRVRAATLAAGLGITSCGWLMQGAALWSLVESLAPGAWPEPLQAWGCCTGYVGVAYAAGFLVLAAPGGLGVRDFLIQHFLAEDLGRTLGAEQAAGVAVVATLLLRLLWTVMDVAAAALCYWLPRQNRAQGSGVRG
jgi:glycosyltransferase 2 family protein